MRLSANVRKMFERAGRRGGRARTERKLTTCCENLARGRAVRLAKLAAAKAAAGAEQVDTNADRSV